jgi:hypothetical protein
MLVFELFNSLEKVRRINTKPQYYNDILGDTSFLLAGLLDSLLKRDYNDWDKDKWIDDSLLTSSVIENNTLTLGGVMIWGRDNTTEQWTDPFSFRIELFEKEKSYRELTLLFSDWDTPEITYEQFRDNRDCWAAFTDRNWKYIINIEKNAM